MLLHKCAVTLKKPTFGQSFFILTILKPPATLARISPTKKPVLPGFDFVLVDCMQTYQSA